MSTKLGVLITYHNEGALLTECLESLLRGESQPDEILVYDDASTTPPEPFIPQNINVKIIRADKNVGPAYGRNELMRESNCDYIHFHDLDDLFNSTWCKRVREVIETNTPDIIFTEAMSFNEYGIVSKAVIGFNRLKKEMDLIPFTINGSILIPTTTFKRELGLQLGGFRTRDVLVQSEDFDFHIRLSTIATNFVVITDALVEQRLRPNSHSQNKRDCWVSGLKAIFLLLNEIPAQYQSHLIERAAQFAIILYRDGFIEDARLGFELIYKHGMPKFTHFNWLFAFIARNFGIETAEKLASTYRSRLPVSLRGRLRNLLRPNRATPKMGKIE